MFKNIFNYFRTMTQNKLIKGFELAFFSAAGAALVSTLSVGAIPITLVALKPILTTGAIAGISYLLHPVPGAVEPAKPEPAK